MGKNGRMKWINIIMLIAVLMFGLSVSALAEEPEIKTFELGGVRLAIPEEFKNTHGMLEWGRVAADCYTPPTYNMFFSYTATSEEDYNDHWEKARNNEISSDEIGEFLESIGTNLGTYYAIKGSQTDLPTTTKDKEIIDLGSVDGFNRYYVVEFVSDAHSNWDKEYLEEAEMLSDKIEEMMKQAEFFKPVDPAAEFIGEKFTFKAEDLDHNWHTSEELFSQNRFTVVNVWGTWCGACKEQLENLGNYHRQIKDKNCGVLGFEHEFTKYEKYGQKAKDILKENIVTYPNVLVNEEMNLTDKIHSHPVFFIVNSEGVVVSPIYALTSSLYDDLTRDLDKLLAE